MWRCAQTCEQSNAGKDCPPVKKQTVQKQCLTVDSTKYINHNLGDSSTSEQASRGERINDPFCWPKRPKPGLRPSVVNERGRREERVVKEEGKGEKRSTNKCSAIYLEHRNGSLLRGGRESINGNRIDSDDQREWQSSGVTVLQNDKNKIEKKGKERKHWRVDKVHAHN